MEGTFIDKIPKEKGSFINIQKSNQVKDFHVPPDHRLGWTKYLFQPITPTPYSSNVCGMSWNKANNTKSRHLDVDHLNPKPVIPPHGQKSLTITISVSTHVI